jgi:hypothetical protein
MTKRVNEEMLGEASKEFAFFSKSNFVLKTIFG